MHMGVRGADRAIAVCDRLRELLPLLLALSANSPFLDRRDTRPAHGAHRDLHPHLPALRGPEPFGDWDALRRLRRPAGAHRTRSSSRRSCGGACARTTPSARSRCGSATPRPRGEESFALAGPDRRLHRPGRARLRRAARPRRTPLRQREIEENLWRAIRHGMGGRMIDFGRGEEVADPRRRSSGCSLDRAGPRSLGIEVALPEPNGAQRAAQALERGLDRGHLPRCGGRDAAHLRRPRGYRPK